MEYRPLGQTDLTVSSLGLGCVTFGREIDQQRAFAIMDHALDLGINLFDTAEAYAAGRSEELIGQWMNERQNREQIVLATKVAGAQTREHILESAEQSLRRLQTDRIDLFKVHNWDPEVPLSETIDALNTLVEQGKARYIGSSNYDADQLAQALQESAASGCARMEATAISKKHSCRSAPSIKSASFPIARSEPAFSPANIAAKAPSPKVPASMSYPVTRTSISKTNTSISSKACGPSRRNPAVR